MLFESGQFISSRATSNEAEFSAVAFGMMDCLHKDIRKIRVLGDSKLTVDALSNKMVIKATNLIPFLHICSSLDKCFEEVSYIKIPR